MQLGGTGILIIVEFQVLLLLNFFILLAFLTWLPPLTLFLAFLLTSSF